MKSRKWIAWVLAGIMMLPGAGMGEKNKNSVKTKQILRTWLCAGEEAPVRESPKENAAVLWTLETDRMYQTDRHVDQYYQLTNEDGRTGYVSKGAVRICNAKDMTAGIMFKLPHVNPKTPRQPVEPVLAPAITAEEADLFVPAEENEQTLEAGERVYVFSTYGHYAAVWHRGRLGYILKEKLTLLQTEALAAYAAELSTDTGRFSCNSPNLQNCPRKTNDPIGVRKFIKAPEGHLIVSCDYSQIELRVGAFYCRDKIMMDTYRTGGDIHAATTSVIFGIPYDEALNKHAENYKERRTIAKNCNFGVFYGLFPRGLQKTLKFKAGLEKSVEDCEQIIASLKAGYPALSVWQEDVKADAHWKKYTETAFGRRRYLPNIDSDDWGKRSFAERCAMNTPIQGTAADIIKLAMGRILAGLPERPWLKPILQIHDELTFILPEEKLTEAVAFIKACMEPQPYPEFSLPLVAEASAGRSFGTMEELEDL